MRDIVYFFDEGFASCTLLSVYSLTKRTRLDSRIYLFHGDLSPTSAGKLDKLCEHFGDTLSHHFINQDTLPPTPARVGQLTFARLLLPLLMSKPVVYIDGDTLIRHDLGELLETNLGDALAGGCLCTMHLSWWHKAKTPLRIGHRRNFAQVERRLTDLRMDSLETYINAGVLVLDLDRIRESALLQQMIDTDAANRCRWRDQDWINMVFRSDMAILDSKYNSMWGNYYMRSRVFPKQLRTAMANSIEDPHIVHFAGPDKPWLPARRHLSLRYVAGYSKIQKYRREYADEQRRFQEELGFPAFEF